LDVHGRGAIIAAAETAQLKLDRVAAAPLLGDTAEDLKIRIAELRTDLSNVGAGGSASDPLDHLPEDERVFFRRMITTIYSHSTNKIAAKTLIDRILEHELPKWLRRLDWALHTSVAARHGAAVRPTTVRLR
jgi:hypothetical protein